MTPCTDWVCAKTDVSRMIHEGNKGSLFTYILLQDWKCKPIYVKRCCKQEYSKEALFRYNFDPKCIIIFPYGDKQIILLTSMRSNNNNPEL